MAFQSLKNVIKLLLFLFCFGFFGGGFKGELLPSTEPIKYDALN